MIFASMKFVMSPDESRPRPFSVTQIKYSITDATGKTISFGEMKSIDNSTSLRVDWGDGSHTDYTPQRKTAALYVFSNVTHTYARLGTYIVELSDAISSLDLFNEQTASSTIWSSTTPSKKAVRSIMSVAPHLTEFSSGCCEGLDLLDVPSGVEVFRHPGVSLGTSCFKDCTSLTGLVGLSKFVISVSADCFSGCNSLTSLSGASAFSPSAARCFYGCRNLLSLTGIGSPSSFGNEMFRGCVSMANLQGFPTSVLSLGTGCFRECTGLTTIWQIRRSSSLTVLPNMCFYGCTSLTSIDDVSNRMTSFGDECFRKSGITGLYAGSGTAMFPVIQSIGNRCFMDTPLTTVNLASSMPVHIGDECFRNCPGLSVVPLIGQSLIELGTGVYRDCYEIKYDANGLVQSERGIAGNLQPFASVGIDYVPAYTFYGDALITSLYGLNMSGTGYHAKPNLGDRCFSGCSHLKNLTGLAPVTTTVTSPEATDQPDNLNVGDGVFSELYFPPKQFLADEPDPVTGQRKWRYRGVTDVSAFTTMSGLQIIPRSTFEGCSLLPDFPPVSNDTWWWGDRCFSRCRNMRTLDSLDSVIPDEDDVVIINALVWPYLPRFGSYCFADCTWSGDTTSPATRGVSNCIYDLDPDNPPTINSGLIRIGGIRILVDKKEYIAMKKIPDLPGYLLNRVTRLVLSQFTEPLRSMLGTSSDDYYKRNAIRDFTEYDYSSAASKPSDGFLWSMSDGVCSAMDFVFSNTVVTADGGPGGIIAFVRPRTNDQGNVDGIIIDIASFFTCINGSYQSGSNIGFEMDLNVSVTSQSLVELSNDMNLYVSGRATLSGSYVVLRLTFTVEYDKYTSISPLVAYTGYMNTTIELGHFDSLSSSNAMKAMFKGFLLYAAASYSQTHAGWVTPKWLLASQLFQFLSGCADSQSLSFDFRRRVADLIIYSENVLGPHCFEGCLNLSVEYSDTNPHVNIDGFPDLLKTIPDYCFNNSGVKVTSAFQNVKNIGKYAFASTPTTNLSSYPRQVPYVSEGCFSKCASLVSLGAVRNGLAYIDDYAFESCSALSSIVSTLRQTSDIDASTDLAAIASLSYTEYVDKYAGCVLAKSLGKFALKGTPITSLTYGWTIPEPESEQEFAKALFGDNGILEVSIEAIGRIDGGYGHHFISNAGFIFRITAGNGQELVFRGQADTSQYNVPGFDMDGELLEDGCLGGVKFNNIVDSDYNWDPPYSSSSVPAGSRPKCAPNAVYSIGYVSYDDDYDMRVSHPYSWYTARGSSTSHPRCEDDAIHLIVGPYDAKFQFCLSVQITEDPADLTITNLKYDLVGVKCLSMTRITGSTELSKVPVFPILTSVGKGCFEACTSLQSLDGLGKLTSLPARCCAGCSFTHNVQNPEVITPTSSVDMPVLVERTTASDNLAKNFMFNKRAVPISGTEKVLQVWTHTYSGAPVINVSVLIADGGARSYSITSSDAAPVAYSGVLYTPHLESVDDEGLVIRVSSDLVFIIPTEWEDDSSSVTFDTTRVYSDTVANEMRRYYSMLSGAVAVSSSETYDFMYSSTSSIVDENDDPISVLAWLYWSRTTGLWTVLSDGYNRIVRADDPNVSMRLVSATDGVLTFECREHTDWTVTLTFDTKVVKVIARSVTIPPNVTDVGVDCFSFDDYPDEQPLQAVYFDNLSPTQVSNMQAFPFGVPPGCSIYAGGRIVYTRPAASS